mmetsp:Transcript_31360/g.91520  ORF Transcript_31360/g.91520 Transcript_31360/m.91520 type:complete len:225 (-) Transcript_31360:1300-1974(-)
MFPIRLRQPSPAARRAGLPGSDGERCPQAPGLLDFPCGILREPDVPDKQGARVAPQPEADVAEGGAAPARAGLGGVRQPHRAAGNVPDVQKNRAGPPAAGREPDGERLRPPAPRPAVPEAECHAAEIDEPLAAKPHGADLLEEAAAALAERPRGEQPGGQRPAPGGAAGRGPRAQARAGRQGHDAAPPESVPRLRPAKRLRPEGLAHVPLHGLFCQGGAYAPAL